MLCQEPVADNAVIGGLDISIPVDWGSILIRFLSPMDVINFSGVNSAWREAIPNIVIHRPHVILRSVHPQSSITNQGVKRIMELFRPRLLILEDLPLVTCECFTSTSAAVLAALAVVNVEMCPEMTLQSLANALPHQVKLHWGGTAPIVIGDTLEERCEECGERVEEWDGNIVSVCGGQCRSFLCEVCADDGWKCTCCESVVCLSCGSTAHLMPEDDGDEACCICNDVATPVGPYDYDGPHPSRRMLKSLRKAPPPRGPGPLAFGGYVVRWRPYMNL